MHAEYKKESERKRIEEKNRLYDLMQFQTADQMQKLSMYMKTDRKCEKMQKNMKV